MTKRLTYAGIAADVTDRIRQGEFPRGAKLPSYRQLADSYGVSVETVKRALPGAPRVGRGDGNAGARRLRQQVQGFWTICLIIDRSRR